MFLQNPDETSWYWQSDTRYYRVTLQKNLFGNWILIKSWGGLNNHLNGGTSCLIQNINDLDQIIASIDATRRKHSYKYIYS